MRLLKTIWQAILFLSLLFLMLGANAPAQERADPSQRSAAPPRRALPAKTQPPAAQKADGEEQTLRGSPGEREDDSDQILQRGEWFYKQRSTADGRIPAGARLKAFQRMQRMMAAEGKLALLRDGTYAAVTPQVAPSGACGLLSAPLLPLGFYSAP